MAEPRISIRKISAGVILVDPQGRVLMQLRDDDPKIMFPGHWGLTGGAGHPGETPEETARREVTEETGLTLSKIEPFKAYYFNDAPATPGRRGAASKRSADYELYLFHAPCPTPAEEMVCGEGRELRFFSEAALAGIDIAYNHRQALEDFFASPAYARYVLGMPFDADGGGADPAANFIAALDAGDPWFDAMLHAIAVWEQPSETVAGRTYAYLIGGEAFDWLLLAERLIAEAGARIPEHEAEQLLFDGIVPPAPDTLDGARPARIADDRLRELIGGAKHRAHLNYLYGVVVEEALQYAVELEVTKETRANYIHDPRSDDAAFDPVFQRIYGEPRAALLAQFRGERKLPHGTHISLAELREFVYWLFKYRVSHSEPARVASDTRKALAQLASMEMSTRRRLQPAAPEPEAHEAMSHP